jgi:hypothetical protein
MEVKLMSVSPVSFMMAKEGDLLEIKQKVPRIGEFRGKIGAPSESFLIFKDKTKIGMIPQKILRQYGKSFIGKNCRVVKMDRNKSTIIVEIW